MAKLYDLPVEFRVYDVDGVVLENPNDFIIVEEPKEFEAFRMRLERITGDKNLPRHGFNFEYGDPETPMLFIKASGYQLIQDIYKIKGSDSQVTFEFGTKAPVYDRKFFAFLDMNTYEREWINGEPRISVNVEQESLSYKINSRLETTLNLLSSKDLDGNTITPLVMEEHYWHGKVIQKLATLINEIITAQKLSTDDVRVNEAFVIYFPSVVNLREIPVFNYEGIPQYFENNTYSGFFLFNAPDKGKYNIDYNLRPYFRVQFTNDGATIGSPGIWELYYQIGDDPLTATLLHSTSGNDPYELPAPNTANQFIWGESSFFNPLGDHFDNFNGSLSLDLNKDDNVYFFWRYFSTEEDGIGNKRRRTFYAGFEDVTSFIDIAGLTLPESTLVRSLPIFEYINRQLELISGLSDVLISDYYGRIDLGNDTDGCGSKRWLTNGSQIRKFEESERPPESSFFDTLNSLSTIDDVGYGYEKEGGVIKVRMEESGYYYQDAEIMKIGKIEGILNGAVGNVLSYKEKSADELIYNEIIITFSQYIEEELNTLDAFNTKAEYLTPIFTKSLKLELLSEFVADAYTIEYTRRKQFEETLSESWDYDNKIFITDWVEITKLKRDGDIGTLGYQGIAFIAADSTITLPIIIRDLTGLPSIIWAIGAGPEIEYTVNSVTFDDAANTTTITVAEPTTVLVGDIEFTFGGGFSFKRPESDQNFSTINNLISPETTYNLRMSLKRILLKHANWINSGLNYKLPTDVIRTQFLDRNKTLQTQLRSGAICPGGDLNKILLDESAELTLSEMADFGRYFVPIRIDYEIELSFNDNEVLRKALTNQSALGFEYGYISILSEEGNYEKIYVNLHDYKPFSSTCTGWGYKKYTV